MRSRAVMAGGAGRARATEPLTGTRAGADRLRVFVSYARTDAAFADEVEAGLEYDGGFDVLIDRHDIHEGEAWKARLGALIAQADTVVFILSRRSAASPICQWEVDHAQALSKRIIPVQVEALAGLEPPPALSALNYVRFDEGRSFMAGLTGLRRALKTDIDWVRKHTRLLTRAQEWQDADRASTACSQAVTSPPPKPGSIAAPPRARCPRSCIATSSRPAIRPRRCA